MRRETKILDTYSDPKFVVQVGNYHGVILIGYTPDKKYESYIDLTLFRDDKFFVTFFARMKYNESYTAVESKFGYFDDTTVKAKQNLRNTPLFEVADKFSSFLPIRIELFLDLIKDALKRVYQIDDEFAYYQVSEKEIRKYYAQDKDEEYLISYDTINNYFYVCKSIFECIARKSEKLIIDDYNFHEFPNILLSCSWIKELELYELLISEIPETLTNLHNLKSLSLKLKFLTDLPLSLFRLSQLEFLKIENTSVAELSTKLFKIKSLKELHIVQNKELKALPDEISLLANLELFYAYSNNIQKIPNTISRLERLEVLYLADNKLEQIPVELTGLTNLRILNLKGNRLRSIPVDLFEMENIEEVNLSYNPPLNVNEVYDLLMLSGRSDKIEVIL